MSEDFFRALKDTKAPFPSAEERLFDDEGMAHHGTVVDDLKMRILVIGTDSLARSVIIGTLKGMGPLAEVQSVGSLLFAREIFLRSPYPYRVIVMMRPSDEAYMSEVIDLEETTRLKMGARWIGYWSIILPHEAALPEWQGHVVGSLPLGLLKRVLEVA